MMVSGALFTIPKRDKETNLGDTEISPVLPKNIPFYHLDSRLKARHEFRRTFL